MITSERQYAVSKKQAARFQETLERTPQGDRRYTRRR